MSACRGSLPKGPLGNNRAEMPCYVPEMACLGNGRAEMSGFVRAEKSCSVPENACFGERSGGNVTQGGGQLVVR